jgi:hypothetical protein
MKVTDIYCYSYNGNGMDMSCPSPTQHMISDTPDCQVRLDVPWYNEPGIGLQKYLQDFRIRRRDGDALIDRHFAYCQSMMASYEGITLRRMSRSCD